MFVEAQIVATVLNFPKEVIEVLEAYEKAHSIDREHMFGVALKAACGLPMNSKRTPIGKF